MDDNQPAPRFGRAPQNYDQRQFDMILRSIERTFTAITNPGTIRVSGIYAQDLPRSDTDLKTGMVWYDEANHVLRIKE